MIKTCIVCNKKFFAKQPNYCLCSDECRRIRQQEQNKKWKLDNPEKHILSKKKSAMKKLKTIHCRICGEIVEKYKVNNWTSHRHYHEECIVKDGIQAIKEGYGYKDERIIRARNRLNYTIKELKEIIQEEAC